MGSSSCPRGHRPARPDFVVSVVGWVGFGLVRLASRRRRSCSREVVFVFEIGIRDDDVNSKLNKINNTILSKRYYDDFPKKIQIVV